MPQVRQISRIKKTLGLKKTVFAVENVVMQTLATRKSASDHKTPTLGELMAAHRATAELELESLSDFSGVSIEQIELVESDRHELSADQLAELLHHYKIPSAQGRFSSPVVEINLRDGLVSMSTTRRRRSDQPTADENLINNLRLLYEHGDLEDGASVPINLVDLSVLRPALALRQSDVSTELGRRTGELPSESHSNRSRLVIATAATGLIVAAAALLLVPGTDTAKLGVRGQTTEQFRVAAPEPQIDIGTALTIERDLPQVGAQTPEPQIDIGTALTIERDLPQAGEPTP